MIYFLRHGESEANLQGVFAGQRNDSPLTKKGIQQARNAAKELGQFKIDRIITSKLKRTFKTASEVAKVLNIDPEKIETDERIAEYDMGAITGTPIRSITSRELTSAEHAENPDLFQQRVMEFIRQYKDAQENILVVSSAGVGRIIEATKLGMETKDFYSIEPYPNAHIVELDLAWV